MSALAAIHMGRKALGLGEEEYRALLMAVVGKASSKEMSEAERQRVVLRMRELGYQPAARAARPRVSRPPHVRLIYALWGELQTRGAVVKGPRGAKGLRSWIARQTGVSAPEFLTVEQAGKCAEGLKLWIRRIKGGENASG